MECLKNPITAIFSNPQFISYIPGYYTQHVTKSTLSKFQIVLITISSVVLHAILSYLFPLLTPVLKINDGYIQGRVGVSRSGIPYHEYLSIPYALPPLGHLRFEPPIPAKPWSGIKRVTSYPSFCVQFESVVTQTVFGEEDCLYLNVFGRKTKPTFRGGKPVLVHIHGGGFLAGGSRIYGPKYLMDNDIILVTFNYRLGPFGFLNFEHKSLPRGNMGMKDQVLVLQWVQANIHYFGGDPKRVTLYGDSAGSVSTHLHVLSDKSKGLFQRAISHSGSGFCSWGFTTQPRQLAYKYARAWGCDTSNITNLRQCLENTPAQNLVVHQLSSTDPRLEKDNLSPSVEINLPGAFLSSSPDSIASSGNFSRVPYLFGVNSGDGALRTGRFDALPAATSHLQANWKELGNVLLLDKFPASAVDTVKNRYFHGGSSFQNVDSFKKTLTRIFSDVFSFHPVSRAARAHAEFAPTYAYYYDYRPRVLVGIYSLFKACSNEGWIPCEIKIAYTVMKDWMDEHLLHMGGAHTYGVSHAEDMFALWNVEGVSHYFSFFEREFSTAFVKLVGDFVAGAPVLKFKKTEWPVMDPSKNTSLYMVLDNSQRGTVVPEPFAEANQFWEDLGLKTFN